MSVVFLYKGVKTGMAADLLKKYGRKVIHLGGPDIGKGWVPPLGGVSPIDPDYVAEPGYAEKLQKAGYRPQALFPKIRVWDLWQTASGYLLVSLILTVLLSVEW
jgi:hypothetical protein